MLVPVLLASLLVPAASARDASFPDAVTSLAQQIAEKTPKQSRLLISNIYDRDGRLTYFGRHLSEKLQAALAGRPEFVVVARQRLDLILDEMRLQQTGLMDPHTVAKTGKMLGADIIVYGTVLDLEKSIDIDLTIQAIESSAIIGTAAQRLKKTDELASLLRSIIDSERKHNEEDLAFAAPANSSDSTKVEALKRDNKELGEVLKTGVWRGGPTFETVAANFLTRFVSDAPTKPAGLWLRAGSAFGDRMSHPSIGASYHLTPSIGLEFDGGLFTNAWERESITNVGGGPIMDHIGRKNHLSYAKLEAAYSFSIESLGWSNDSGIRFPLTFGAGGGLAYVHIRETRSDRINISPSLISYDDADTTFDRLEPVASVSITHYVRNFIGLRLAAEKIFSNKASIGPYKYTNVWWTVQLTYRIL